ncbi:hypothetical protein G7A66_11090 [Altererythrobacter sp. SALINAS58]|uniref:hypothetical protein n=1 Tax=Alteripontixanthobacter muriae TaxID=2705546 RepID=UPI00157622D8|nr:hypothetical protein [Alteripontixanthobacter muriae]NTZ43617.1 hypothetical protein [Alteripontixanthobacter muriae]
MTFDDKAHAILQDVLDYAEERLTREGSQAPDSATTYLTLEYINASRGLMSHASQYLESDEWAAAAIFLSTLPWGRLKQRLDRNSSACARQLARNTCLYFPNFRLLLRLSLLQVLSSAEGPETIRWNGIVLLAAASLPGVRADIRRELRRRGLAWDVTLVGDLIMEKRIGYQTSPNVTLLS